MSYTLRPYQQKAIDDLYAWFESHPSGHPIVEACVASGKSLLIAEFCRRAIADYANTRILMAVHVKELVKQNLEKLVTIWPDAPVGVCSASIGKISTGAQIIFGSIQTIANRVDDIGHVDLMIVDECHLVNPNGPGQYRAVMSAFLEVNPDFRVIGFTGTPFRGDGVWLTEGDDPIFTHITSRIRIPEMMKSGYLSSINTHQTQTKSDVSDVKIDKKTGDYKLDQLAAAVNQDSYITPAVTESIDLAQGRSRIMVFTADIGHCEAVTEKYREMGESVAYVHSGLKREQRDDVIDRFTRGEIRWLVNVAILTTGFDVPQIDCIVLMRPTVSPVLYIQIVGRGLRLAPGKNDCLWLDFTNTTASLGPVDSIKGRAKKQKGTGTAPYKVCDECGWQCATATRSCPECGHEFPFRTPTLALSNAEILSTHRAPQWVPVRRMSFHVHRKVDKRPTICVTYSNGLMAVARIYLSVHIDANEFARARSHELMRKHGFMSQASARDDAQLEMIRTAFERQFKKPSHVLVKITGKSFPEVIDFRFEEEERSEQG